MKHIKLKVMNSGLSSGDSVWWVRIMEQTHRGEEFGAFYRSQFVANNGLILESKVEPSAEYVTSDNKIYMRGSDVTRDWHVLVFFHRELVEKFRDAVMDYNRYFSKDADAPRTVVPAQFEYEVG